jgi:hypothetical protein
MKLLFNYIVQAFKAIRTAPLSKHTSKGIFRPSHLGFSSLNQLLPHPYLLYIRLSAPRAAKLAAMPGVACARLHRAPVSHTGT